MQRFRVTLLEAARSCRSPKLNSTVLIYRDTVVAECTLDKSIELEKDSDQLWAILDFLAPTLRRSLTRHRKARGLPLDIVPHNPAPAGPKTIPEEELGMSGSDTKEAIMYRFLQCRVSGYMTRAVKTVTRQISLRKLATLFEKHDFNTFPVVEGGKYWGWSLNSIFCEPSLSTPVNWCLTMMR